MKRTGQNKKQYTTPHQALYKKADKPGNRGFAAILFGPGKPRSFNIRVINADGEPVDFPCRRDEPVIEAMIRAGKKAIKTGCRGGGCGACMVKVEKGKYKAGPMSRSHVTPADVRTGRKVLSCKLYPKSKMVLRALPEHVR